jgi:hypothetical protein
MDAMLTLATICLNEQDFIGEWLEYHYDSFDRIVLCEGAARNYPADRVTPEGLSLDATAEIIRNFPDRLHKIRFIQYGWAGKDCCTDDRVPAKMELRNVYAAVIDQGYVFTLDADEFLHPFYVNELAAEMECNSEIGAYAIPQLHLWQSTRQFIVGRYADVPHFRLYRWRKDSRYIVSHNWPSGPDGVSLTSSYKRARLEVIDGRLATPAIIHYGFCEPKSSMAEKNSYYASRGEAESRPATFDFRRAALQGETPAGCTVQAYRGFLPFEPPWLRSKASLGIAFNAR